MSRKTGYVADGRRRVVQHTTTGKAGVDEQRVLVTPATYVQPDGEVAVSGAGVLFRFLAIQR